MRQTRWHVITGAPCAGKTSAINGLERMGYPVVHEVARWYMDKELSQGRSLEEIRADMPAFQRHILYKKIEIEISLPKETIHFLDRAIPDSVAYYTAHNLNPAEPLRLSKAYHRYRMIFLFDRFEFKKDITRTENDPFAARVDRLIEECYHRLGYAVVRVPVLSTEERIDFILNRIYD